ADLLHDVGDARAVVPASPNGPRGGPDDAFVGDLLAAGGGPPGGGSAHMMIIIYQSGAERKTVEAQQGAKTQNQDSPDPEGGRLPVRLWYPPGLAATKPMEDSISTRKGRFF